MKTVKAYQSTSGKLFSNRDDYVRQEIIELVGKDAEGKPTGIEAALEGIMAFRATIVELLHEPKRRGPRKPKVTL